MRTALIIVISMKDKDNLSWADYRFTFLSEQALKLFPTFSVVLNKIMIAYILPNKNGLKIE